MKTSQHKIGTLKFVMQHVNFIAFQQM